MKDNVENDRFYSKENYRKNDIKISLKTLKENFNSLSPLSLDNERQNCGNHAHKIEDCKNQSSPSKPVEIILSKRSTPNYGRKSMIGEIKKDTSYPCMHRIQWENAILRVDDPKI